MRSISVLAWCVLASSVAWAEPPVPAKPAPSAVDAKALDDYLVLSRPVAPRDEPSKEVEHVAATVRDPAAIIAANLRSASALPASPPPYSTECRGDTCFRHDGHGKVLFRIERDVARNPISSENGIRKYECLGKDDMLDTFERLSRCNGIGVRLPTPWDPVESIVPLADRP